MELKLFQYFQLLSLVLSLVFFRGLSTFRIQAFVPLLFLTNTIEIIGNNYRYFGWETSYPVYNIWLVATLPFTLHLMQQMLHLGRKELLLFRSIALVLIALVWTNFLFLQGYHTFNTYSLVLIKSSCTAFSALALIRLVTKDDLAQNLWKEPYFWINAVNMLFCMVVLVVLGLQQYIRINQLSLNNQLLYSSILPAANIVLYSGYAYAFYLCRTKRTKSYSPS